jgi:hypothetical protein
MYQKILKQDQGKQSSLVIWQHMPESGDRRITDAKISVLQMDSALIHLELISENSITTMLPIYCYSEEGQFLFKTSIQNMDRNILSIRLPEKIQLLDAEDVTDLCGRVGVEISTYWKTKQLHLDDVVLKSMRDRSTRDQKFLKGEFNLSLDEEDKIYADKREAPRARPKVEKTVKIKSLGSDKVHSFRLFDLSQGGIGFITLDPQLFTKGTVVKVVGFEDFNLDDALVATVMSQRPVDEIEIEFKIGCKFNEGQD